MVSNEERRKIAKKLRAGAEYLENDIFAEDLGVELDELDRERWR